VPENKALAGLPATRDAPGENPIGLTTNPTTNPQAPAARESCDVSVIIPVYNRASLLRWPLASIAAQTLRPREVIVVDDHSAPEEAAIIRSIVGEFARSMNVKILVTERNSGNSYARNRGIDEAHGKYVAILDSDDLWLPDKLEKQMRSIESARRHDSKPVFSATGTYRVDSKGNILHCKRCQSAFDAARIRKSNYIPTSSVVVETSVVREIKGFAEDMRIGSDWEFFIRLVGRVQFVAVPDLLSAGVDHQGERLSQNNPKTLRAMLHTRRKHMRGIVPTSENSGFYRKVAQELQTHGKLRMAKKFYIRSIGLRYRGGWRRGLIEGWLALYFSVFKMPSLKERRRIYYLRKLDDLRRDPKVRHQWDQDQKVIKALMS
jgi:glycosyltransferase involved in cell wall biosynthesis